MKKNKDKKNIIKLIMAIALLLIFIILIIIIKGRITHTEKNEGRVEKETKIITTVKEYMTDSKKIFDYAKENKLSRMTIRELNKNFKINISKFSKSVYNCNPDTSFVEFDNEYTKYTIFLDCEEFYE